MTDLNIVSACPGSVSRPRGKVFLVHEVSIVWPDGQHETVEHKEDVTRHFECGEDHLESMSWLLRYRRVATEMDLR